MVVVASTTTTTSITTATAAAAACSIKASDAVEPYRPALSPVRHSFVRPSLPSSVRSITHHTQSVRPSVPSVGYSAAGTEPGVVVALASGRLDGPFFAPVR